MQHADVASIWAVPDDAVTGGHLPGYAAAVRIRGRTEFRVGGRMALDADSPPVNRETVFRIASLTKPIGAVLALSLAEDGALSLDDPIATWLPEASRPRVLSRPDGSLEHTVPARRPVTVRDLLAGTSGWGAATDDTPLHQAMIDRGVEPGPTAAPMDGDEFVRRVTALPLAFQPGDGWRYHTGMDLLGILLARLTGRSVASLLTERVTGPLGMTSTGFWTSDTAALPTAYEGTSDHPELLDPPDGAFAAPPPYEALASGLLSTVDDLLRFFCAMADGGEPVLSASSVTAMTTDALTERQRISGAPVLGTGESWGLGVGVDIATVPPYTTRGRWGWAGGTGTIAYVDPTRDTVSVLLTQRGIATAAGLFDPFLTAVAAAGGDTGG